MIVNMSERATEREINHVIERVREAGYQPHVTRGTERTIVAAVGSGRRHEIEALQVAPGVDNVVAIAQPFKLVSRQVRPERSIVKINGVAIGGHDVVVIAGPCSVESREQLLDGVWGSEIYIDERTVDVHVGRLRKALNRGHDVDPIRTVRGAGYALDDRFGKAAG